MKQHQRDIRYDVPLVRVKVAHHHAVALAGAPAPSY